MRWAVLIHRKQIELTVSVVIRECDTSRLALVIGATWSAEIEETAFTSIDKQLVRLLLLSCDRRLDGSRGDVEILPTVIVKIGEREPPRYRLLSYSLVRPAYADYPGDVCKLAIAKVMEELSRSYVRYGKVEVEITIKVAD